MKKIYFPRFISPWSENSEGIEIRALTESISFGGMNVNAIAQIEQLCSGNNPFDVVVAILSVHWDAEEVVYLLGLLIEKKVIINQGDSNPLAHNTELHKIETILPNETTMKDLSLPYTILYGRAGKDIWSCGKGSDLKNASEKLVSEIAEWNAWKFPKEIVKSKYGKHMVHPEKIVRYHPNQYLKENFSFKRFSQHKIYDWVVGKNIKSGKEVLLLSDHVLFPYNPHHPRYSQSTSSGCAAHVNTQKAIPHAIYELIERDAFMIFWLNKLECPRVEISSLPKPFVRRISNLEKMGYTLVIKNISMGIAPVVMIAVKNDSGRYLTLGLASSGDFIQLIDSALSEVEVSILHILNSESNFEKGIPPEKVVSLQDHEELHQQLKYSEETQFIFNSSEVITFMEFKAQYELRSILDILFEQNFEVLMVDASDWDIDVLLPEKRSIIRVIIPGLIPLSYGYQKEPLGMERIYTVPVKLGFRKEKISYEEVNRFPHPFN